MKTISASDAKRRFPQLLRAVKAGQTYIVTSRGEPVARIEPIKEQSAGRAKEALLQHLQSQKAIKIGPWTRDELYD